MPDDGEMKRVNKSVGRCFCRTVGLLVLLALLGMQSNGGLVGSVHASILRKCDGTSSPRQLSDGFRSLSIGMYHSLLVKNDGSLWAWGSNRYGALGDGAQSDRDQTVPKQIGTGFRSAVAGSFYSLAVKEDGTLWSWGENDSGQLGDGTKINRSSPQQIGSGFRSVAAGWGHSFGIKGDWSLWVWGRGCGALGIGTDEGKSSLTQVAGDYVAVFAGQDNSVALRRDGSLWAWDHNVDPETGKLSNSGENRVLFPIRIGNRFKAVAVGRFHGLGLKNDGSLWTWGGGLDPAVLGDGTRAVRSVPAKIDEGFVAVAAGHEHSVALKSDGTVWAWGGNFCKQLGFHSFSNYPTQLHWLEDVASVFAAGDLSFATKKDGTVWAWGRIETIKQLEAALADGAKADDKDTSSTMR